jgi:hypothetical protein
MKDTMRSRFCVIAAFVMFAAPAEADRATRPRNADAAALVQGDWVLFTVEHEGIVTDQIPDLKEQVLDQRWEYMHVIAEKRDEAALRAVPPVLPPDTPVYRFAGGHVTIWENLRPGQQGTYRFEGTHRPPALEVAWADSFGRAPDHYRFLYRFGDDTMAWCCDTKKPGALPAEFVAKKSEHYILTFRRLK